MDHLNTWKRARVLFVARKYKRKSSAEMDDALKLTKKIDEMFRALPQNIVADAAFKTKSYARALQNYERILYNNGARPVTEQQTQYENLHHIYAELNEPDGMEGVSVSILSPSIQHQIREHEMTGRWTSAQSCWEVQLQLEPHNPASHLGLLRCLTRLGHYGKICSPTYPKCLSLTPVHRLFAHSHRRLADQSSRLAPRPVTLYFAKRPHIRQSCRHLCSFGRR